jgi:hypothetical protein
VTTERRAAIRERAEAVIRELEADHPVVRAMPGCQQERSEALDTLALLAALEAAEAENVRLRAVLRNTPPARQEAADGVSASGLAQDATGEKRGR